MLGVVGLSSTAGSFNIIGKTLRHHLAVEPTAEAMVMMFLWGSSGSGGCDGRGDVVLVVVVVAVVELQQSCQQ